MPQVRRADPISTSEPRASAIGRRSGGRSVSRLHTVDHGFGITGRAREHPSVPARSLPQRPI